jgi:hypothetical protein
MIEPDGTLIYLGGQAVPRGGERVVRVAGTGWTLAAGYPTAWQDAFPPPGSSPCTARVRLPSGRCGAALNPAIRIDGSREALAGRFGVPVAIQPLHIPAGFCCELDVPINGAALREEAWDRAGLVGAEASVEERLTLAYTAGDRSLSAGLYARVPMAGLVCSTEGLVATCRDTSRGQGRISRRLVRWERGGPWEDGAAVMSHTYPTGGRKQISFEVQTYAGSAAGASVAVNVSGEPPPPPDRDGDGVPDATDRCPAVPGPLGGCPDADGDTVPECGGNFPPAGCDECPGTPGPAPRGCPVEEPPPGAEVWEIQFGFSCTLSISRATGEVVSRACDWEVE